MEFRVKLLHPDAKLPVCAHPGEDLGFDIFSLEDRDLCIGEVAAVRTGIVVELRGGILDGFCPYGLLIRDRSSVASAGVCVVAGVIDAGYRGEILVKFINHNRTFTYSFSKGDKIAQMIPVLPQTLADIVPVSELSRTTRGVAGFGSTGR